MGGGRFPFHQWADRISAGGLRAETPGIENIIIFGKKLKIFENILNFNRYI